MKNMQVFPYFLLVISLGLLLFALVVPTGNVMSATPQPTNQPVTEQCNSSRTVSVTGSALINVTPDRALVQLGVQSNGTTVDAVQKANTQAIQQVIAAMKLQGLDAKDISTDLYMIEPVYENYDSLFIKGYRIHNTVAVTVREVKNTSAIVAAALAAGANQVNDIGFYTSQLRKYRDQARELAMTAAREKAQALAMAAGAETGCVLSIGENSSSFYNGWWYGSSRNGSMMTQNTIQNAAPAGGPAGDSGGDEPISLGQISVKAEVNVSYALK
jgi:uncharacterized protein YggE